MKSPKLTEQDIEAIRTITKIHENTTIANDWNGWLDTCVEDMVIMAPDGPAVKGRSDILAWFQNFPTTKAAKFNLEAVNGNGEIAFSRGSGPMTVEIEGKLVEDIIKWLAVFNKQDDGSWKTVAVMWNSNQPVST